MTDIHAQLKLIAALSVADQGVLQVQEQLNQIPVTQAELRQEWNLFRKQIDEKETALKTFEADKSRQESDLREAQESIKKKEARLFEIKTNKEYQSSLKEIADSKKVGKDLEDKILVLMSQLEGLSKEVQELTEQGKIREKVLAERTAEMENQERSLQIQLQEALDKRQGLVRDLDPKVLAQYERVKKVRADAVTFLVGRGCQGCHLNLPPQLYNQVLKGDNLYTCPNCQRLICLKEETKEGVS